MNSKTNSNFKVATYNVNHSRRAVGPYEAYSWDNRKADIYNLIKQINADCWLIQEIPCEALDEFVQELSTYQWICCNEPYRGGNFTAMAIGLRVGEKFSRVCKEAPGLWCYWKRHNVVVSCQHFPMGENEAYETLEKICEASQSVDKPLIIGGDYNSFPDVHGPLMMLTLNQKLGTYSCTEFATNTSDSQLALKSFYPYPFDFVPESALKASGKLDHILARNVQAISAQVHTDSRPNLNWKPSDHFPVSVEFTVDQK